MVISTQYKGISNINTQHSGASPVAEWLRIHLNAEDPGSILRSGRSPGGGHGNPL